MMTNHLSTYKYWDAHILTSVNYTLTEVSFTYLTYYFHNAYISLVVLVLTSGRV
jgi:hypothetical protein